MSKNPSPLFATRRIPPSALNEDPNRGKSYSRESRGYWHPPEDPDLHVKEFYCVRHHCVMKTDDMAQVAICDRSWESGTPFQQGCVWQYHNKHGVMTISEGMTAYIVRSTDAQEPV